MSFLGKLRNKNIERQKYWAGSETVGVLFRAVEFAGEAGELSNAVKKLYRARNSITGNSLTEKELYENLVEEMGDVLITLDLLAQYYDVDLEEATKAKFNKTSKKVKIDVFLD
jgi:NTP pyrophosphatase (non-canonical NTP hydrolase)